MHSPFGGGRQFALKRQPTVYVRKKPLSAMYPAPPEVTRLTAFLCALLMLLPLFAVHASSSYVLDTADQIRITVHERPELSATRRVWPPGVVSLPVVGEVSVAGLTPAELEQTIAKRLGQRSSGATSWVSVEVVGMRPFFILGDVSQPGSYEYVHGMTVLHAISLAGGYKAINQENFLVRAELSRSRERWEQTLESLGTNIVLRARLRAETENEELVAHPPGLSRYLSEAKARETLQAEQRLLEDRQQAVETLIQSLEVRKDVFDEEIRAHEGQIIAADEQLELIDEEIRTVNTAKGIVVPKTHVISLRRLGARIRGEKREQLAFIARAKEQKAALDEEILRHRSDRRIDISEKLKAVEDTISQLAISENELRHFLATAHGSIAIAEPAEATRSSPIAATIVRKTADGTEDMRATLMTPVLPGDVVRIPVRFGPRRENNEAVSGIQAPAGADSTDDAGARQSELPSTEVPGPR